MSPRHCGECGKKGKIISTRREQVIIIRRLVCVAGHRFSTVETIPRTSASGRALTAKYRYDLKFHWLP